MTYLAGLGHAPLLSVTAFEQREIGLTEEQKQRMIAARRCCLDTLNKLRKERLGLCSTLQVTGQLSPLQCQAIGGLCHGMQVPTSAVQDHWSSQALCKPWASVPQRAGISCCEGDCCCCGPSAGGQL